MADTHDQWRQTVETALGLHLMMMMNFDDDDDTRQLHVCAALRRFSPLSVTSPQTQLVVFVNFVRFQNN